MTSSQTFLLGGFSAPSQQRLDESLSLLREIEGLDRDVLERIYETLSSVYDLLDRVLIATGQGIGNLKQVLSDVEKERAAKAFQAMEEQIKAQSSNIALRILKVIGFLFGVVFLAALPMPPVLLGAVLIAALGIFAGVLQEAVTGESFLKDLMLKMANGNETVAHWLTFAMEIAFAAISVAAAAYMALPAVATTAIQQAVKQATARLASVFGKPSEVFEGVLKQMASSIQAFKASAFSARATTDSFANFAQEAKQILNGVLKKIKEKAPFLYENAFSFVNGISILSGMVMGALSIDKSLADLRKAGVEFDVALLDAVLDAIRPMIESASGSYKRQADDRNFVDEAFDTMLDTLAGRN